jgi:hypothetical protein
MFDKVFDNLFVPERTKFCRDTYGCEEEDWEEALEWYDLFKKSDNRQDDPKETGRDQRPEEFTETKLAGVCVVNNVQSFRYLKECFQNDPEVVRMALHAALHQYDDDDYRMVLGWATPSALDANLDLVKQVVHCARTTSFPVLSKLAGYQEVLDYAACNVWTCITKDTPKSLLTREVALKLVGADGNALQKFLHFADDYEVVLRAASNTCCALAFCAEALRNDASIVRAALLSRKGLGALHYATPSALSANRDLFRQAVQDLPSSFLLFKDDKDYDDLLRLAVDLQPSLVEHVERPSLDVVIKAVSKDFKVLAKLPTFQSCEEVVLLGARQSGTCMAYLPDSDKVFAACLLAKQDACKVLEFATKGVVKRQSLLLSNLLAQHLELLQQLDVADLPDLMVVMCAHDTAFFKLVPESHLQLDFVMQVIAREPRVFRFARTFRAHPEVARLAVSLWGRNLKHTLFVDRDLVLQAVKQDGTALEFAKLFMDREVVLQAVEQNGTALRFAPSFQNDIQVCRTAYKQNVQAYNFMASKVQPNFEAPTYKPFKVTVQSNAVYLTAEERNTVCVANQALAYLDALHVV